MLCGDFRMRVSYLFVASLVWRKLLCICIICISNDKCVVASTARRRSRLTCVTFVSKGEINKPLYIYKDVGCIRG